MSPGCVRVGEPLILLACRMGRIVSPASSTASSTGANRRQGHEEGSHRAMKCGSPPAGHRRRTCSYVS
jgi:hypothetical protein